MDKCTLAIVTTVLLLIGGAAAPASAAGQAVKLHEHVTSQGETVQIPYITYAAFAAAAVGGKALSSKSSGEKATLGDLVTVSPLDEVTRLLGEPEDLSQGTDPWGTVRGYLEYKGMRMEYIKTSGSSSFRLREMRLRTPDWSLTVNGVKLRPGGEADRLSSAVRQTMRMSGSASDVAEGYIYIAKPGIARNEKVKFFGESTFIGIEVDQGTDTIKQVRFHRLL